MGLLEIMIVAIGLALDSFAVALSASAAGFAADRRAAFRLAFHFALFQAIMPLLGWLLGFQVAGWVAVIDHWIAFALLAFIGGRMIRSSRMVDKRLDFDPSRGHMLILLSVATSIDALVVGFSLAMLGVGILTPCVVIGLVTAALAMLAISLGARLGIRFGKRMEMLGGLMLIGIGLRILLDHLFF